MLFLLRSRLHKTHVYLTHARTEESALSIRHLLMDIHATVLFDFKEVYVKLVKVMIIVFSYFIDIIIILLG